MLKFCNDADIYMCKFTAAVSTVLMVTPVFIRMFLFSFLLKYILSQIVTYLYKLWRIIQTQALLLISYYFLMIFNQQIPLSRRRLEEILHT